MRKEARARIKINRLLEEAGWRFLDNASGKANIVIESNVKITQRDMDAFNALLAVYRRKAGGSVFLLAAYKQIVSMRQEKENNYEEALGEGVDNPGWGL